MRRRSRRGGAEALSAPRLLPALLLACLLRCAGGQLYSWPGAWTFTPAGASGALGPDGPSLRRFYSALPGGDWAANASNLDAYPFRGYQLWSVPQDGLYTARVCGAGGAPARNAAPGVSGGRGVCVTVSNIAFAAGAKVIILVGQAGSIAADAGGGGGASALLPVQSTTSSSAGVTMSVQVTAIAAGGGGAAAGATTSGWDG